MVQLKFNDAVVQQNCHVEVKPYSYTDIDIIYPITTIAW